ncbi:hypothetical protein PC9H_010231 [Pleurotus ostreatus]|uniref:Uncharacterized protein n=1 Tax=Pleurotus ostreatus TaxID=5322 RepID=A0A8H6ZN82_PLEOS|nr:uncharacterized protein PC9H_010231 [Pleurotus ostreatus]KAF7424920.1 hypothetical protein PC9H_010231 [Pleurotus ostreatus]
MSETDYQRHRSRARGEAADTTLPAAIQIRVKSPHLHHTNDQTRWLSISFKVNNEIKEERIHWIWGDLDWIFKSPVELCSRNKALIEIRPGLSSTTDSEVFAGLTFEDIIAFARSRGHAIVDFQRDHQLASIIVRVRVSNTPERYGYEDARQDVKRRDSLKDRVSGYLERPFRRSERHEVPQDYWVGATPYSTPAMPPFPTDWRDPSAVYPPGPAAPMYEIPQPWQDPMRQVSPQAWADPEPSDTGKIEYTVVGTRRPKPH